MTRALPTGVVIIDTVAWISFIVIVTSDTLLVMIICLFITKGISGSKNRTSKTRKLFECMEGLEITFVILKTKKNGESGQSKHKFGANLPNIVWCLWTCLVFHLPNCCHFSSIDKIVSCAIFWGISLYSLGILQLHHFQLPLSQWTWCAVVLSNLFHKSAIC